MSVELFHPSQLSISGQVSLSRTPLFIPSILLQLEQLLQYLHRILRSSHGMTDRPGISVDLVVIPALEALVTEEVDSFVIDARDVLLRFDVLKAVCLVPAVREDVEGDLAAN